MRDALPPQPQSLRIPELTAPRACAKDRVRCRTEPGHHLLAAVMRAWVRRRGVLPSRQSRHWADALATMERHLAATGVTWADILATWTWYAKAYDTDPKGLPALTNATQFRERWDWLRREMGRRGAGRSHLVITPEAQEVGRLLSDLVWRPHVTNLAPAVQGSLAAVRAFVDRLTTAPLPADMEGVRNRMLDTIGAAGPYVVRYVRQLHERLNDWAGWNGNLLRCVWAPDRLDVTAELTDALRRYTGDPGAWDRLRTHLEKT